MKRYLTSIALVVVFSGTCHAVPAHKSSNKASMLKLVQGTELPWIVALTDCTSSGGGYKKTIESCTAAIGDGRNTRSAVAKALIYRARNYINLGDFEHNNALYDLAVADANSAIERKDDMPPSSGMLKDAYEVRARAYAAQGRSDLEAADRQVIQGLRNF